MGGNSGASGTDAVKSSTLQNILILHVFIFLFGFLFKFVSVLRVMRSVLVFEFSMLTIEIKPDQRERQTKEMFARLKKKSSTFIQFHPFYPPRSLP